MLSFIIIISLIKVWRGSGVIDSLNIIFENCRYVICQFDNISKRTCVFAHGIMQLEDKNVCVFQFSKRRSPSGSAVWNHCRTHPAPCVRPRCVCSVFACTCTVLPV